MVPDPETIDDCSAEVGKLKNIDELLADVKAECDSLSSALNDTKKRLRDFKAEFYNPPVEKKGPGEQVIKQDKEILLLVRRDHGAAQEVARAPRR